LTVPKESFGQEGSAKNERLKIAGKMKDRGKEKCLRAAVRPAPRKGSETLEEKRERGSGKVQAMGTDSYGEGSLLGRTEKRDNNGKKEGW